MLKAGLATAIAVLALAPAVASATEIKVNNTADGFIADGKCGLREAVEAARDNQKQTGCPKGESKRDVILLKGTAYNLTVPTTNEGNNVNGDLDLQAGGPITVRGAGKDETTINNPGNDRVFDLPGQLSSLRLERLHLNGGDVRPFGGADGLGGSIRSFGGNLTISKSEITSADADSGGHIFSQGKLLIDRSEFSNGLATADGGGLYVTGPTTINRMTMNQTEAESTAGDVRGGAIFSASTAGTTIVGSALKGNGAHGQGGANGASGGTVYVDNGSLTLRRSEISNNTVSAITNGEDENGAGLYADGGSTVDLVNSTLFGNQAGSPDGVGGAIYNVGTVTAQHTSFIDNIALDFADQVYTAGTTSIGRSIITGDNTDDPCAGATVNSLGFNVAEFDDPSCGYDSSDDPGAFLSLASLADNGGPTNTVAFNPNSDGIDFVPKAACKAITGSRDQRGYVRPNTIKVNGKKVGQPCDAGAFELGARKP